MESPKRAQEPWSSLVVGAAVAAAPQRRSSNKNDTSSSLGGLKRSDEGKWEIPEYWSLYTGS